MIVKKIKEGKRRSKVGDCMQKLPIAAKLEVKDLLMRKMDESPHQTMAINVFKRLIQYEC